MTLSIMTLSKMTLSIMTLSKMKLSIMTLSIIILSIMAEHSDAVSFVPSVTYAECYL